MGTDKIKTWNGCSITFSITIGKNEILEKLTTAGNYTDITKDASEIVNSLRNEEPEGEQIMDIELVEFEDHPNENDVQNEFKKRGLLFPENLDALRFGAKYHNMGTLLNNIKRCCVMFPYEVLPDTRMVKRMLAINYYGENKILSSGGFGTQCAERWYFAGLRPHKKE